MPGGSTARPRISPDRPETAGLLRVGREISPPGHQRFGMWMDMMGAPVRGVRPRERFSASSGCCPRPPRETASQQRLSAKCRSLDSLRSLGMTNAVQRSPLLLPDAHPIHLVPQRQLGLRGVAAVLATHREVDQQVRRLVERILRRRRCVGRARARHVDRA